MATPDTHSLDPEPAVVAEIDRRAARVKAEPESFAAMDGLWRSVYELDRWVFIARGAPEAPSPYIAELAQGPVVFAFTTAERARAGGVSNGLSPEEASLLLTVPLPGAIEWVASLAQLGVAGIAFDIPMLGYYAPLGNLVPMRDFMVTNPPAV